MKSFKQLMESLVEAWPGSKEYTAKYGTQKSGLGSEGSDGKKSGNRHDIEAKDGVIRATRKYGKDGESEEQEVKSDGTAPTEKRGRGRPAGKYGSYKKKVKESIEFMESLDDSQLEAYLDTLDEETLDELNDALNERDDREDDEHGGGPTPWQNPDKGWRPNRITKAKKNVKEDVEQIEELSKSTLGSYVKKVAHDLPAQGAATRQFANNSEDARTQGNYVDARKNMEKADKTFAKSWKRRVGVGKAVDRLTKEDVEQIEELSKDTLGSYVKKASDSKSSNAFQYGKLTAKKKGDEQPEAQKAFGTIQKRSKGISKAVDRLTKEDVDQVEEAKLEISAAQMSHQGKTTIKHIKNPSVTQRMAAHDIKPGVAGYRDRIALLKDAQAKGNLKDDVELPQTNTIVESRGPEAIAALITKQAKEQ